MQTLLLLLALVACMTSLSDSFNAGSKRIGNGKRSMKQVCNISPGEESSIKKQVLLHFSPFLFTVPWKKQTKTRKTKTIKKNKENDKDNDNNNAK